MPRFLWTLLLFLFPFLGTGLAARTPELAAAPPDGPQIHSTSRGVAGARPGRPFPLETLIRSANRKLFSHLGGDSPFLASGISPLVFSGARLEGLPTWVAARVRERGASASPRGPPAIS